MGGIFVKWEIFHSHFMEIFGKMEMEWKPFFSNGGGLVSITTLQYYRPILQSNITFKNIIKFSYFDTIIFCSSFTAIRYFVVHIQHMTLPVRHLHLRLLEAYKVNRMSWDTVWLETRGVSWQARYGERCDVSSHRRVFSLLHMPTQALSKFQSPAVSTHFDAGRLNTQQHSLIRK